MDITQKQADLLGTIESFISDNGYAPTYKELADIYDVRINTIFCSLKVLKSKGYVDWVMNQARTLHIIKG